MKINAFCTDNIRAALESCDRVIYCGERFDDSRVTSITRFGEVSSGDIYIPSMCDEQEFEAACDYIITTGAHAFVRAAYELNEAGIIEARYKLSPIMLLHKMGVLGSCTVVGGVCLDNDDLDLMAQEGVRLVVTPTASAGYGHGFAPICAALRRGIVTGVGTFDNKYNSSASVDAELEFLKLTANAEMKCENALIESDIVRLAAFK